MAQLRCVREFRSLHQLSARRAMLAMESRNKYGISGRNKKVTPVEGITEYPLLAKFYGGAREEMMRATLAGMGRTPATPSQPLSIAGQKVPANQTGNFTVCFLIPKNMPKEFTLQIESIGSVILSESLAEID